MIVAEMIKVQKQRGLTDSQFAESLGIHKVSWYRNKRTEVISGDVLLRAFEVYPELQEKFLSTFANQGSKIAAVVNQNIPQKPLSQILSRFRAWLVSLLDRLPGPDTK